jgi:MFS family permease
MSERRSIRRVALASLLGATIEWYDFFLYGVVAGIVFNKQFFPADLDSYTQTIFAYLTFAIGYLARPFGAFIFGHFGDRVGRKSMLVITLLIMGTATVGIGLIPTYSSIGIAAPLILQTLRLCQGFGLGGEWGGAVLLAYEHADEKERAFYASFPQMGLATGLVLATGAVAALSWGLTDAQFLAWGWRTAFLGSIVLVAIATYIRLTILETPDFVNARAARESREARLPIVTVVRNYPRSILLGIGGRWIDGVYFNVFAVFLITFLTSSFHMPRESALLPVMAAALVMCPFMLFSGRIADRIGRGRLFGLASLMCGLSTVPALHMIYVSGGNPWMIWPATIIPLGVFYSGIFGPQAALFAGLFPPHVRFTGISVVYQFPSFLVAGIVPALCTYLLKIDDGAPYYICGFVMFVSLVAALSAFRIQRRAEQGISN